ncbi:MAG: hypothetical protein DRP09_14770 [Candidatus Thorarchaeota archaeon]|nr:MAG: hypothetical protein DRP09_14770 [Candidatus Thorarchaeota archaeon]
MANEKIEKFRRKLKEFEEKKREQAKIFKIDEVLADSNKTYEVYVPEIDAVVKYKKLTIGDLEDIKGKTDEEIAIRLLWKMLNKADPEITLEKVKQLPIEVATAILQKISAPLFQMQKQ